jgi:hypothetical protein
MNNLWPLAVRFSLTDYKYLLALASPWREEAERVLRAAGVVPQSTQVVEEALQALEFQQTDFLLFSEGFGASDMKPDLLLTYIQALPSALRRNFFVILISPKFRSGDFWTAFSYSVNLVLHPEHLPELVERISQSWSVWKDQYRVFLQSQS